MKNVSGVIVLALGVALWMPFQASAGDKISIATFKQQFKAVPAAELPAKAADAVANADPKTREATTVAVVKAAVGLNPASAPAIVGAIARSTPEMAAVAARAAASLEPKQASTIARAAAAAAPEMAGKIVEAVCREVPSAYRSVAVAVAEVCPKANKEILQGVAAALPALSQPITRAMGNAGTLGPKVPTVLDQAAHSANLNSPVTMPVVLRGPTVKPPYIPLTGTPTNAPPGGGEVPPGGRDYASP